MTWIKGKQLFNWEDFQPQMPFSHASVPFALALGEDDYLIYFAVRDKEGKSLPFCIKAQIVNGDFQLIGSPIGPLMDVGKLGTFDDSGVMPTCVVRNNDEYWMYYIGWNPQVTVSYRLSIGLAISKDGIHFERYSDAPLMDRSLDEPYFNTAPFVLKEVDGWVMYYVSCSGWQMIEGRTEPQYGIKRAFSQDGIRWTRENKMLLEYDSIGEAFGRPCILQREGVSELFFSYRKLAGYRSLVGNAYRTAMASFNQDDGHWLKHYEESLPLGLEGEWDQQMACYGHVFSHQDKYWMLYNGNDFGKTGFGYAQWIPKQ